LAKRIAAKATVLTVLTPFHTFTIDTQMIEDTPAQYKVRMKVPAERTFGAAAHATQAAGVACETVQVEQERPYQAIIDTAESKGCDLIVMASHRRHGISAIVLGSEAVKVLHALQDPGASPSVNHSSRIQHAQMPIRAFFFVPSYLCPGDRYSNL
jgi:nucleotide-binding universal stress UspA family protein